MDTHGVFMIYGLGHVKVKGKVTGFKSLSQAHSYDFTILPR